jgi:hypothetical protein
VGGTCVTYGGKDMCSRFLLGGQKVRDHWEYLSVGRSITLRRGELDSAGSG